MDGAWHAYLLRNPARSDRRALCNRIASTSGTNREQRLVLCHSASASSIAAHLSSTSTGIRNRHAPVFCFQSRLGQPFNSTLQTALQSESYADWLYSLAGVLGLLVTSWAGSLTDRHGPHVVVIGCLIAAAIGATILLIDIGNPVLCVIGFAIFDAGCLGTQTANQVAVVSINPPQSGKLQQRVSHSLLRGWCYRLILSDANPVILGMDQSDPRRSCFARRWRAHPIAET
ncbi:MFS transporter [Bifidobacterium sp. ESL0827]|uniref:MFS transporter n=1 Tax=Bifidobacterium sp. ESL0827 TaxID=3448583 RepID=UPI0040430896